MASHQALWFGLGLCVAAAGCGGGGEALVSGSATGEYAGETFTASSGVASTGEGVIVVGDADLDCGSLDQDDPPRGKYATIEPPDFAIGSYTGVDVTIWKYEGMEFGAVGANVGELTIDGVTADSVSAEVAFDYTDTEDGSHFAIDGAFEVVLCD